MRRILPLTAMLLMLCGLWTAASAENVRTENAQFAAFDVLRDFYVLDVFSEPDCYDAFFRANFSYSNYSDAYYLDRVEMNVTLERFHTPEAAAAAMQEAMAAQLTQEPEGSVYAPLELEDGSLLHTLVRPGDGFDKPYECRGVKGNVAYRIILYLSDPAGEPEERTLLIRDMIIPVVTSLRMAEEAPVN